MWWNAYASTLLRPPLLFNCPRFERQNQKREQPLKGQGRNHTQINGGDRLRVVSKKCPPGLHLETVDWATASLPAAH